MGHELEESMCLVTQGWGGVRRARVKVKAHTAVLSRESLDGQCSHVCHSSSDPGWEVQLGTHFQDSSIHVAKYPQTGFFSCFLAF